MTSRAPRLSRLESLCASALIDSPDVPRRARLHGGAVPLHLCIVCPAAPPCCAGQANCFTVSLCMPVMLQGQDVRQSGEPGGCGECMLASCWHERPGKQSWKVWQRSGMRRATCPTPLEKRNKLQCTVGACGAVSAGFRCRPPAASLPSKARGALRGVCS